MKRLLFTLATALCMAGWASQALAITISLTPSSQTIGVSGIAYLNLVISGLGSMASPSLGGFFIDLTYNSAIVSANSVAFGTGLGSSAQFSDTRTAGQIHLDEVSFEDVATLNSTQLSSFTLATLGFTGIGLGTSSIDFDLTFSSLSDELGNSLTFGTSPGSITVINAVPDSASSWSLLALGLLSLSVGLKARSRAGRAPGRGRSPSAARGQD